MTETPRNDFVPNMERLKQELGRNPPPAPVSRPEDYAPKHDKEPKRAAYIAQALKVTIHGGPRWLELSVNEQEALDLIATAISRLLTYNVGASEFWSEIAGQASEAM